VDIVVTSDERELLPGLGSSIALDLADGPASVRELYARVPGVASEPVTTAILVAVAGHFAADLAQQLFTTVARCVKQYNAAVTIEVPATPKERARDRIVVVTPESLRDVNAVAALEALLAAAEE
jgi:hypothetical protein